MFRVDQSHCITLFFSMTVCIFNIISSYMHWNISSIFANKDLIIIIIVIPSILRISIAHFLLILDSVKPMSHLSMWYSYSITFYNFYQTWLLYTSVHGKLQATRAKVTKWLIYGSHFSATEATYKVNLQEHLQELHISLSQYKTYLYSRVYIFTLLNSNQFLLIFYESHWILPCI